MLGETVFPSVLSSNGQPLSTGPLGYLVASDPKQPMAELREQYAAQGYLWLKGLLDPALVLAFRRTYFEAFQDTGLLAADSEPIEGRYAGGGEDQERVHSLRVAAVRWPEYEAFCLAEPIQNFYRAFLGGPIHLHKRKLLRHTIPGDRHNATGAHYDLVYLRGGTDQLCTSWLPLGDVPKLMGGLVYLENSHHLGREMERELHEQLRPKGGWVATDLASLAEQTRLRWLVADYEAGDMVVHSPYMIHASTDNNDPTGRMRLSTDIRYQRLADPIDQRWANHWSPDDNL